MKDDAKKALEALENPLGIGHLSDVEVKEILQTIRRALSQPPQDNVHGGCGAIAVIEYTGEKPIITIGGAGASGTVRVKND